MQSCAADGHWLRMFKNKNEIAIRTIEGRLECCGYNSMRDRAWPFPSKGIDARTCERTQGYYIACGGLWLREQQMAAATSAVASFLNWLLVVSFSLVAEWGHQPLRSAQMLMMNLSSHNTRRKKQPAWMHRPMIADERSDSESAVRSDIPESGQARRNYAASTRKLNADARAFEPGQAT